MGNIPEKIDSKYRYVLLASRRAEQLIDGAPPKVETMPSKPTRVAMSEIAEDLVVWDYGPAVEPEEAVGEGAEGGAEGDGGEAVTES